MSPSHVQIKRVLIHQVFNERNGETLKPVSWVELSEGQRQRLLEDVEWPEGNACRFGYARQDYTTGDSRVAPAMLALDHLGGRSVTSRTEPIKDEPCQEVSLTGLCCWTITHQNHALQLIKLLPKRFPDVLDIVWYPILWRAVDSNLPRWFPLGCREAVSMVTRRLPIPTCTCPGGRTPCCSTSSAQTRVGTRAASAVSTGLSPKLIAKGVIAHWRRARGSKSSQWSLWPVSLVMEWGRHPWCWRAPEATHRPHGVLHAPLRCRRRQRHTQSPCCRAIPTEIATVPRVSKPPVPWQSQRKAELHLQLALHKPLGGMPWRPPTPPLPRCGASLLGPKLQNEPQYHQTMKLHH